MARRSRATSAVRRHQRNIDLWAVDRQQQFIYTRCWLCGREFVVNNYSDLKVRVKKCEVGGKILCGRCRGDGNNWARRFVQMYLLAKKTAEDTCFYQVHLPVEDDSCKGPVCVARRLVKAIDDERPRRRLYRKKALVPEDV